MTKKEFNLMIKLLERLLAYSGITLTSDMRLD